MVLILGDFSMHIRCPSMSGFTADFINWFESFNLEQSVKHPAHDKGHVLDLVLSYGVSLNNTELLDSDVSDYKAVVFHTLLLPPALRPSTCIHSQSFNSESARRYLVWIFHVGVGGYMMHELLSSGDTFSADIPHAVSDDKRVCSQTSSAYLGRWQNPSTWLTLQCTSLFLYSDHPNRSPSPPHSPGGCRAVESSRAFCPTFCQRVFTCTKSTDRSWDLRSYCLNSAVLKAHQARIFNYTLCVGHTLDQLNCQTCRDGDLNSPWQLI